LLAELGLSDLEFHTFGCKVNTYDTGLLAQRLEGLTQPEKTKIHVINSCAVTAEATTEALRRARQLKRATPGAYVVLTGCSAQVDSRIVDGASEIDLVIANSHKTEIQNIVQRFLNNEFAPIEAKSEMQKVHRSNIFRKEDLEPGGGIENEHTRSFLKIQDGCNSFCSFCVIPYARGKSRSLSRKDILTRINQITVAGIREIVLTGIHLGDYCDEETGADFTELIRSILGETSIPRLRLSSLEPIEISIEMLKLFSDDRLCPHFHMSIQSASTKVLTDMKRKYSGDEVRRSLDQIKSYVPQAFVGMDVIVGFPSETRAHFEETYLNLCASPWSKIHVFPYSERQGTRAALMTEKVEVRERKQRAVRLRELSDERLAALTRNQLGTLKKVLILNKPARGAIGLSRDYFSVDLVNENHLFGQEISAEIIAIQNRPGREPLLIGKNIGVLS
jgi:threonylcarbamoyladenosine tRNA methylthiotransferase MtaB